MTSLSYAVGSQTEGPNTSQRISFTGAKTSSESAL